MSMNTGLKSLLCLGVLIPSLASAQGLTSLNQDDVKSAFSDKTFTTISAATLNGNLISNKFTGYFSNDGKMNGKFADKPGSDPQQDTGSWRVNSDGALCYKWNTWNSGQEKCAAIYKLNNGLLVVNSQNGFESFIPSGDMKSGNQLQ